MRHPDRLVASSMAAISATTKIAGTSTNAGYAMGIIPNPVVLPGCLASKAHVITQGWPSSLPAVNVASPVNVPVLHRYLSDHPDRNFVNFLNDGFTNGFSIGYRGFITPGQCRNLLSARQNIEAVSAAISKEVDRGHTIGPFPFLPFTNFHCSPLGAVPKKDGTHRIILDLSSPRGSSINEGISPDLYSVHYSSFDDAVNMVRSVGHGNTCFLAKLDIKHAFRLCPVHPSDWPLLGYMWQDQFYVDIRLPFGSRSSPFIFNQFAEALLWILVFVFGVKNVIHYLDDFFICARSKDLCQQDMDVMQCAFSELGVPLAPDKVIGPSTCLTYLGIDIDTVSNSTRLPDTKYSDLLSTLSTWSHRKKCTKRDLLSLIGSLSFACKVVKPGRMFLRRLIDLSTTVSSLNHHISLNSEACADIAWWLEFLPSWNGVEFIQSAPLTSHALQLFTDASSIGFGAVYGTHWFSVAWPSSFCYHINFLELFAIVAAVFTWGDNWVDQQIILFTDNYSVTEIWRSGRCKDRDMMRLVRALFLFTAKFNINILMKHIPGKVNILADSLSRLQEDKFHRKCRHADPAATPVSSRIWDI